MTFYEGKYYWEAEETKRNNSHIESDEEEIAFESNSGDRVAVLKSEIVEMAEKIQEEDAEESSPVEEVREILDNSVIDYREVVEPEPEGPDVGFHVESETDGVMIDELEPLYEAGFQVTSFRKPSFDSGLKVTLREVVE